MIKNFIKTAWRSIFSNKFYSAINILGLTAGLVVGIFLLLWIKDELSFDRFHKNQGSIYKIGIEGGTGISKRIFGSIIAPVGSFAKREIPEVQDAVRILRIGDAAIKYKDKRFREKNFAFVDPSYFSVFDFPLIQGNQKQPFPNNNSVVLTETTAHRYFGDENPIGKTVVLGIEDLCVVSGVIPDYPENSSFQFQVLLPLSRFNEQAYIKNKTTYDNKTYLSSMDEDWSSFSFGTYLQLRPDANPAVVAQKLQKIHERNKPEDTPVPYVTQELAQMHLYQMDGSDGGIGTVRIFIGVALMILVIASINYINLSTARSLSRSKEVGIRKIIGAGRKELFFQFILETTLLFSIAATLAVSIVFIFLPFFNNFSGKHISLQLSSIDLWSYILIMLIGTLLLTSIYPALLLSNFDPIKVLKGRFGMKKSNFRKILVVLQFTVSIVLITMTIVIGRQLEYIRNKNLGYEKSNIIAVSMAPKMAQHFDAVKSDLLKNKGVSDVIRLGRDMVYGGGSTGDNDWDGKPSNSNLWFSITHSDHYALDFFKIKLTQGKNFTGSIADSTHFLINETAVREMGLKNPIGARLRIRTVPGTIIGVVKDFNYASVRQKIEPMVFQFSPKDCQQLYIKTNPTGTESALHALQQIWKSYYDDMPISYSFLDESYQQQYMSEQKQGTLFNFFAIIAILISCLGLLGLCTYTAQLKTKEIGIRKVLGATVFNIMQMLNKEFLLLIIIANIIALPVALYFTSNWLDGFAFRTTVPITIFLGAGFLTIMIALFTVSFQSIKAAIANPVKSLKDE
ncbi:ABC transporter permease [Sphingobacterium sp. BIGb0165]|uniref:ABC transporter permease n=1 Tax=Sphingobacterium sp. BIGb0165 TaxID=2940615 RepID=UPI002167D3EB|nr:ABC transporter permease [Sphingobacterium sp. BIGb0165]MCS4228308.1 putative ABC transport system permease protein [Sphingobacterium sp. BIGb0165]